MNVIALKGKIKGKDREIKLNWHSNSPLKVNKTNKDYQMRKLKRKPRGHWNGSFYFQGWPFTIDITLLSYDHKKNDYWLNENPILTRKNFLGSGQNNQRESLENISTSCGLNPCPCYYFNSLFFNQDTINITTEH